MPDERSGAQIRKDQKAAQNRRLASELGGAEDYIEHLPPLADVIDDPDLALEYGRKALLIALDQVCRSETLPTMERWRSIQQLTAAMGMTQNRAALEARTKRIEDAMKDRKAGSAIVGVKHGSKVRRPPTARGSAPPGPRAVPLDASVTKGEDDEDPA